MGFKYDHNILNFRKSEGEEMDIFEDGKNRLYRYFSNGGWELYDGVEIAQDNKLTVCDIAVSVAINSRVDTRNKIWFILQEKSNIEKNLSNIPTDILLESNNVPWDNLYYLFESFCKIKFVRFLLLGICNFSELFF